MLKESILAIFTRNHLKFISYEKKVKISDLSWQDLSNLEISHQECMKLDNNFNIKRLVEFDRDANLYWPDCSIIGDHLYRMGKLEVAYEMFKSIYKLDIDPNSLPTWSQGIYGMNLDDQEYSSLNLKEIFQSNLDDSKIQFCVGFDEHYFSFLKIFCASLSKKNVIVNAVYCYDKEPKENIVEEAKKIDNLNLFGINTPESFSLRNRKGFYTLVRYLLCDLKVKKSESDIIAVDIDSIVNDFSILDDYKGYDVGILELKRPRRAWLKHTAPFLYVSNNKVGKMFSRKLASKCTGYINLCNQGINISLWGVDQACITSTIDYFQYQNEDLKYFNFIKSIDKFLIQAQSISKDKSLFLNKYLGELDER